jgi:hypothetical protein
MAKRLLSKNRMHARLWEYVQVFALEDAETDRIQPTGSPEDLSRRRLTIAHLCITGRNNPGRAFFLTVIC